MNDLINKLNINKDNVKIVDGLVTVILNTYDEAALVYNKLENLDTITKNSEESYLNIDDSRITYIADDFDIILELDMVNDIYRMTLLQVNEDN